MKKLIILFALFLAACSGAAEGADTTNAVDSTRRPAVKMRHQILFSSDTRQDVFEGYMILVEDGFLVKAFAGPGVELFTVARRGDRHKETLHISGLADRIDVARVGADINRIYMEGCAGSPTDSPSPEKRSCTDKDGGQIVETLDEQGDVTRRTFPEAHGVGLTITFESYSAYRGHPLAKKITMQWGSSNNRMVILTTAMEVVESDSSAVIENVLAKP